MNQDHYIECPKYKGWRSALACISLDRYRFCRRRCKSLESHIKANPDVTKLAEEKLKSATDGLKEKAQYAGASLPDSELRCQRCGFLAKSVRGLRCHATRTHQIKYRRP